MESLNRQLKEARVSSFSAWLVSLGVAESFVPLSQENCEHLQDQLRKKVMANEFLERSSNSFTEQVMVRWLL
jgi:hypothetical protein